MADTLFPVFDVPEITVPSQGVNRPYQPSVYFDYAKGDFRLDGAYKMTVAAGREAYMQWCVKVVSTERNSCLAYSSDIGIEGEAALAQKTHEAVESALERAITDALMVNVHTEYVRNFEFEWSADTLTVSFIVKGKQWVETTLSTSYSV